VGTAAPDPRRIIESIRKGGADVLLTSGGVAGSFTDDIGSMGLLVRADAGTTILNPSGRVFEQLFSSIPIEECNRLGADGVITMLFSLEDEVKCMERTAATAAECNRYGLGYCVEAIPGGFSQPLNQTIENVSFSARLACEMGADFVKVPFVGEPEAFREQVVECCYKPVIILGGGGSKSDEEILTDVRRGMDAGCKGIAYGRLLWSHPAVEKICTAITKVIHEDASVQQALLCCR
jgi:class I fructose-bisphosphate aldolase